MTDSQPAPSAPLRTIAALSGRKLDDVYRLFRLPQAPSPCAHVACVPVYDTSEALTYLGASPAKRSYNDPSGNTPER